VFPQENATISKKINTNIAQLLIEFNFILTDIKNLRKYNKLKKNITLFVTNPVIKSQILQNHKIMDYIQINSKLRLEAIKLNMAEVVFDAIDRNREYLKEWLPFIEETHQIAQTEEFIKSIVSQRGKKKDEVFTIWYNQEFAGLIGFKDTDWINYKTELGYWLTEKMQGKGIATACVKELVKIAFKKLGINRVQIKVACGNIKSASIPKRLGFQFEGTERQGEFHHGGYFDLEIYSFLKSDYLA
jgi:ribosomal-protein-serine acetyltransferase